MKKPILTKEEALKVREKFPTPFYIYDEAGIRQRVRDIYKAFSWNKGFREYFAVKATPNPFLLKILKEEGCGADCSSLTELMMSRACGFSGSDIMFSSNATPKEDFLLARELNAYINFDDITHIPFCEKIFREKSLSFPETVCLRYNPGGTFKASNSIMDNPGEAKYGLTPEQMGEAFEMLKKLGVRKVGIHAFLASNTKGNEYYPVLARQLFSVAVKLAEEHGLGIAFVNLSGGIGIAYRPEEQENDIFAIGNGVKEAYEEVMTPAGMGDTPIFTELGRFVLAPFGQLVSTVLHEKKTHKDYIGLDACAANLMRPAIYGAYHHITVLGKENAPCDHTYDVTGGLCENSDKFAVNRLLPKIDIGDIVVMHDAGAHGFSMGYNYNGKLRSAEILKKEDGSFQLIRRAETPRDYFATFDFSGLFDNI